MKQCTYCGKAFPDEATVCEIDGNPLQITSTPLETIKPAADLLAGRKSAIRAAMVAGVIFLFIASKFANSDQRISWIIAGSLALVLLTCGATVMLVFFFSRRSHQVWSWVLVIPVTLVSYLVFTRLFVFALRIVLHLIGIGS